MAPHFFEARSYFLLIIVILNGDFFCEAEKTM